MRYVQEPACGYGMSNTFTYVYSLGAKPSYITEGVSSPGLTIVSTTESDAGSAFTVTVTNAMEVYISCCAMSVSVLNVSMA